MTGLGSRILDGVLEASVVGSFTRLGYDLRNRTQGWGPLPDMAGRRVVITGPTSGLGKAAATRLAGLNADLILVGRDRVRTEAVATEIDALGTGTVNTVMADMSELSEVASAAAAINATGRIDVLLHNAGALLRDYTTTSDGFEVTYACHVLGPFRMTHDLLPALRLSDDARVITMTSGGMYAEALDTDTVQMGPADYDGVRAYARAKRAQVVLAQQWAQREPEAAVFHTVHPGWADTPGVVESLPRFHSIVGPLLRSPEQGADTLCWLASASEASESNGVLWLDRLPRHTSKLPWTITGEPEADALWRRVGRDAGV